MKVTVNGKQIFEVSEARLKVLRKHSDFKDLGSTIRMKLSFILQHKYERCLERLKAECIPQLQASGVESLPLDDTALCERIFAMPTYKDRKAKEIADGQQEVFDQINAKVVPFHPDLKAVPENANEIVFFTVAVDGEEVFELTPMMQRVILNDIHADIFLQDMCRRLHYMLDHPFRVQVQQVRKELTPKLIDRKVSSVPIDDDAFVEMFVEDL